MNAPPTRPSRARHKDEEETLKERGDTKGDAINSGQGSARRNALRILLPYSDEQNRISVTILTTDDDGAVTMMLRDTWYIIKIKLHSSCEIEDLSTLIFASMTYLRHTSITDRPGGVSGYLWDWYIDQFREFESPRVHTRKRSRGLFFAHILTCGKRESVSYQHSLKNRRAVGLLNPMRDKIKGKNRGEKGRQL